MVPANWDSSGEAARSELRVTGGGRPGAEADPGRLSSGAHDPDFSSSLDTDCRFFSLCSSSSSSAISISLLRRTELVEDELDPVDPDEAWSEQAAESFVSLSSVASAMEKVVSNGAKCSHNRLK
jgi:hypothetical protein